MNKENLKNGIVSEKDLVNIFATTGQAQKYFSVNKFTGNNKNILLKEVSRYCSIVDLGNRQYEISEVKKYPIPKIYDKMNKSLYQYIVPLILNKLIDGHDKNNKITLTSNKWARQIQMINGNYNLIKFHKKDASDKLDFRISYIEDFYNKADDMINNYLEMSLKYLKQTGSIIWREVYMVHMESVGDKIIEIDDSNNIYAEFNVDEHQATQEEMEFFSRCVEAADKIAGIDKSSDTDRERYYGKKALRFTKALSSELNKRNIKYIYKTYEVYYIHLDRCKDMMRLFNNENMIENFNHEFEKLITDNATKRYKKGELSKYSEDYVNTFVDLCEITINSKTESMAHRLDLTEPNPENNYNLKFKMKRSNT